MAVIGEDKDGDGCGEPVKRYKKPDVGRIYPIETPIESDEFNTRQLGCNGCMPIIRIRLALPLIWVTFVYMDIFCPRIL